ncbi:MAG: hypothetical protein UDG86_00390 [Lachnospiraceae bacterium]|nr:hypothetical protein [Lachnospiraceae bacterium]
MIEFIIKYWLECLFALIVSGLAWCVKKLNKRIKEQESIKDGVLAILHDRIFQAARYYISQGCITIEELRNVQYLYDSYHELGGNGTGTELFERIKKLEIKED